MSLWQEPIENYAISVLRVTTLLMRPQSHFGGNKPTDIGDDFSAQPSMSLMALRVISLRCNGSSAFGAMRTWLDLLVARPGRE